jgi:hypothetical protein
MKQDNLAVYTDGHEFCFGCSYHKNGDKIQMETQPTQTKTSHALDSIQGLCLQMRL